MTQTKITVNPTALFDAQVRKLELQVTRQDAEIQRLRENLKYERKLRQAAEESLKETKEQLKPFLKQKRKRRTKAEIEAAENSALSTVKSNGVRKATKADCIRSYTDYRKMYNALYEGNPRDALLWTLGISFGLRVSDISRLRWRHILKEDFTFRDRIKVVEKKTSKLQNCLITEAVVTEATKYLNSLQWKINFDDYVFQNIATGEPIGTKRVYEIITKACQRAGLEYHISTHSMRSTFANIVLCLDKTTLDMNALTKIQALLNHSDVKCTMRYLGTLHDMLDRSREIVSDFLMGKTDTDVLEAGITSEYGVDDVMARLSELEEKLSPLQINP